MMLFGHLKRILSTPNATSVYDLESASDLESRRLGEGDHWDINNLINFLNLLFYF